MVQAQRGAWPAPGTTGHPRFPRPNNKRRARCSASGSRGAPSTWPTTAWTATWCASGGGEPTAGRAGQGRAGRGRLATGCRSAAGLRAGSAGGAPVQRHASAASAAAACLAASMHGLSAPVHEAGHGGEHALRAWSRREPRRTRLHRPERHAQEAGHGDERAFIFEGNEPGRQAEATYDQALQEVCRLVSPAGSRT